MKILEVLTEKRKTGNLGEKFARSYLKKNGYKIREKNYVANNNEIDIIAENKTTLAFIEVKTRNADKISDFEPRPASAVTPEKQRGIISAANCYIAINEIKNKRISLDVIEVYLYSDKSQNRIIHMENAFNINTAYKKGF